LTGDTGTIRYMAPEVSRNQPYTEKADVYSFGVLLWQIMSLEEPYGKMTAARIEYSVANVGLRPIIDPSWSNALRRLLQDCFADPKRRPSMEVACSVLLREVNSLGDKKLMNEELKDSSRSAMSARDLSSRYYDD
jgi:serine/threonine protein kinase